MRKLPLGIGAAVVVAVAVWWAGRGGPREEAYALTPKAAVWSRLAQVREPLAELHYGEKLYILERREEHARVRTAAGVAGWIESRHLISADIWKQASDLRREAAEKPAQGRATTKVRTNLRLEPGRDGAPIYQFLSDTPVEVLARRVVEWTPPGKAAPGEEAADPEAAPAPKREDWLLVRGPADHVGEIAGWVLGRFLAPSYPQALRDYAAGIRFVAWFELAQTPSDVGPRPVYLAAGVTGAEGQSCDFTLLRVYTWHVKRKRYETAYVESFLCGRLPLRVSPAKDERGEASFFFTNAGRKGDEDREYRFRLNIVRRVRK
jgi:hypothetical protein